MEEKYFLFVFDLYKKGVTKQMKRLISILLCLACFLGAFVSCQSSGETNTAPESTETQTQQAPSSSTYDDRYQKLPEYVPPTTTATPPSPLELAIERLNSKTDMKITREDFEALCLVNDQIKLGGNQSFQYEHIMHSFFEKIQALIKAEKEKDPAFEYTIYVGPQGSRKLLKYENGGFEFDGILWDFDDYGIIKSYSTACRRIYDFSNNEVIETVRLGDGVRVIERGAFENCPSLIRINTVYSSWSPENTQTALEYAYCLKKCDGFSFSEYSYSPEKELEEIDPGDYEALYEYKKEMYDNTYGKIKVVDDNPNHFIVVDGVLMAYLGIGGHVVIPEGVREINGNVFSHCCYNVLSITFPSTFKALKSWNIVYLPKLIELNMPDGLEKIESLAVVHGKTNGIYGRDFIKINNIPEDCEVAEDAFSSGTMWAYKYFYNK